MQVARNGTPSVVIIVYLVEIDSITQRNVGMPEPQLTTQRRGRRLFSSVELEVAWAASLWMAAYNAREEALLGGDPPVGADALRAQAAERLRRANA